MTPTPLRRVTLPWVDPGAAFAAIASDADAPLFWLDSGGDATVGRSWMGTGSRKLVAFSPDDAAAALRGLRDELEASAMTFDLGGAPLGWIGWLGYELGQATTGVALTAADTPALALLRAERLIGFDHAARSVELVGMPSGDGFDDWAEATTRRLAQARSPLVGQAMAAASVPRWRHGPTEYAAMVRRAQESIRRGDAYQLCLTNTITLEGRFDPLDTYRRLRSASPTHHGGFVRIGHTSLLSSSPEQFLRISRDGHVTTRPIKGTRPRGATLARDIELRSELEASDKEQAENLMIVDLMRNDLGRVAALGTVSVSSLLAVESYAQVHQLVSTVEADLAPGIGPFDAIEACFPAGSMTGAPKISAMRILAELERGPRGVYSGAFGYLAIDGSVDLAMVIRSILLSDEAATIGTGGGITALSVPEDEVEETRVKAAALLTALGASVH